MSNGKKLKMILRRPNDDKDQGSEKTFSIEKNNNNDEYDIALEYGDSSITPPENIKQIMDSIIQDFGEIPEEYLEPAGDGGYNKDEEE